MRFGVIAFNERGGQMARRIQEGLPWHEVEVYIKPDIRVSDWAREQFQAGRGMIFVGACGIAVRAIAPLVDSKLTDPPVLVVDDAGRYVISLLSGHVGGANVIAAMLASQLGALPVITTASDLRLAERPYILGIGCRKGKTCKEIEDFVSERMAALGIEPSDIFAVASIDLKRGEAGLCEWVEERRLSFVTFSAEELEEAGGGFSGSQIVTAVDIPRGHNETAKVEFSGSDFVKKAVGVDNVCERAALLASGRGGELISRKQAADGITLAVARRRLKEETDE